MKIAVVGGGVFGTTISWYLAKNGFQIDLFEKEDDIFKAASGINQYRLHRGYHYPRSVETILTCINGELEFRKWYSESLLDNDIQNYYCISKNDSFLTSKQISKVWDKCGLKYVSSSPSIINFHNISDCFQADEFLFDHKILKNIILKKLKKYNVRVFLGHDKNFDALDKYDFTIIATYTNNNVFLKNYPRAIKPYQYEICEKIVVKLPEEFKNKSVVVLDGPFTCIDPYGNTGYHVMGNVVHAIHDTMVGESVRISKKYYNLLNRGIIQNPSISNFGKFIESGSIFFNNLENAKYIGSMFTVRTVLPFRDHDDARPTIVENIDNKIASVFSGKISTCVSSAKEVLNIVNQL